MLRVFNTRRYNAGIAAASLSGRRVKFDASLDNGNQFHKNKREQEDNGDQPPKAGHREALKKVLEHRSEPQEGDDNLSDNHPFNAAHNAQTNSRQYFRKSAR